MDITISGYEGENVIAQIIEDLLTVNGLSVKRDEISPINGTLNIEQLDLQLGFLRKNKTIFNIKVLKEDRPKYVPKKMSKFKTNLPDLISMTGRLAARMDEVRPNRVNALDDFEEVFAANPEGDFDPVAPIPAIAPARAANPQDPPMVVGHYNWPVIQVQNADPQPLRAGDQVLFGGAVGNIQAVIQDDLDRAAANFIGVAPAQAAPAINPQEALDEMPLQMVYQPVVGRR